MSQHRLVQQRFWEDAMQEEWSREEREVMLYLITCPQSQVCGLFPIAIGTIAHYWGITFEEVEHGIRLLERRTCLFYDNGLVFIRKYLEGQRANRLGKIRDHVRNVGITSLKLPNRAAEAFIRKYFDVIREDEVFHEELIKGLGEPFNALTNTLVLNKNYNNSNTGGREQKTGAAGKLLPIHSGREYFLDLLPEPLQKPEIVEAWRAWVDERAERGEAVGERYARSAIKLLTALNDPLHALLRSVAWKGIHADEQHEAQLARAARDREKLSGQQKYIRQEAERTRKQQAEWDAQQRAKQSGDAVQPTAAQREFQQALDQAAAKMRIK